MKNLESDLAPRKTNSSKNLFTILFLLLLVFITAFLLIRSSLFSVGSVVIEGNKYVTVEEIYRIAGIPEKINIFSLDSADIRTRLMKDLRIADVTVTRKFPGTIVIQVQERNPLAYVASSYGFVELDKQGVVLAAFKNLKQVIVPMITGFRLESGYVGDKITDPTISHVLSYLALLDEETLNQLSEVNVSSTEQITAYTIDSVQIRLGNEERLAEKAKFTNDILKEMQQKKMAVEYIDLNYSSPFIKFKQKTN